MDTDQAASKAAEAIQEIMHHSCSAGEHGGCLTHGVLKATIKLEMDKIKSQRNSTEQSKGETQMKKIMMLFVILILASGCQQKCTQDDGVHSYGKWEYNDGRGQFWISHHKRVCTNCGWTVVVSNR